MTVDELLRQLQTAGVQLRVEDGALRYTAKKGSLSPELKEAILGRKEELLERLSASAGGIARAPRDQKLPLSFPQERIVYLSRLDPTGLAWSVPVGIRIRGRLDVAALEKSFSELIARHEILRTVATESGGTSWQQILPPAAFNLPVVQADGLADADRGSRIDQEAALLLGRRFDLQTGPLLRATLLRFAADDHAIVVTTHLFVCDGWSLEILFDELGVLYQALAQGARPALMEPGLHYADFSAWQRKGGGIADEDGALDFWRRKLEAAPPTLEIAADLQRAGKRFGPVSQSPIDLGRDRSTALRALARAAGATPFSVFLAAWQLLLSTWSGQKRLLVGTVVSNRGRTEFERMPGTFANTVALLGDLERDLSFREFVQAVQDESLAAFAHQDLPFERLVEELGAPIELRALFVYHQRPLLGGLDWPGLTVSRHAIPAAFTNLDVHLVVSDQGERFEAVIETDAEMFGSNRRAALAAQWIELLDRAVTNPESRLSVLQGGLHPPIATAAPMPSHPERGTPVRPLSAADAPVSDLERSIAAIFTDLTSYRTPSVHDNFFDIGGHSLSALQAIARIEKLIGIPVDPGDLMMQTLGQLAATLSARRPELSDRPRASGLFARLAGAFRRPKPT